MLSLPGDPQQQEAIATPGPEAGRGGSGVSGAHVRAVALGQEPRGRSGGCGGTRAPRQEGRQERHRHSDLSPQSVFSGVDMCPVAHPHPPFGSSFCLQVRMDLKRMNVFEISPKGCSVILPESSMQRSVLSVTQQAFPQPKPHFQLVFMSSCYNIHGCQAQFRVHG